MEMDIIAFLMFFGFIAAFIDAAAGGGGLISLPALLWVGIPPVNALATNKMAAVMGAAASFLTFIRSGKMDVALIKKLFPLSLIGSFAGVLVVREISPEFLRPFIVVMLILVFLYTLFKKEWGRTAKGKAITGRELFLSGVVALVIGFYDGFFGPGTGTFLLFAFIMIGFDFLGATANTKALNFASNLSAMILFWYLDLVVFEYAIPMGVAMIIGAYAGSRVAITKGVSYVRPMFIVVTGVLIGKQIISLF